MSGHPGFPPARTVPPPPARFRRRELDFSRARVMGVLNLTPDSFSDGGMFRDPAAALDHAARMAAEGADIIDLGGESTRPGAAPVGEAEELRRVMPVLERLDADNGPIISIDTRKPAVAREALRAGAHMVNDLGGLALPAMRAAAAEMAAAAVAVHMQGGPATMQEAPRYEDVVGEVAELLAARAGQAEAEGVPAVFLDPGIGFGKRWAHNRALLRGLPALAALGRPLVVGVSRKAFLPLLDDIARPTDRLVGSKVGEAFAVWGGANVIRTHDVRAAVEAIRVAEDLAPRAPARPRPRARGGAE